VGGRVRGANGRPCGGCDAGAGRAGVKGTGRRYEPVLQVAEIMLTLVTVIDPPLPEP